MVTISAVDPSGTSARAMAHALWEEIQQRYGFCAPDPFDPAEFAGPVGRFWVASDAGRPIGSVGLAARNGTAGEVDVMYVATGHRRQGVAGALLHALEEHARAHDILVLRLRAGDPQPEALRFYERAGFVPTPAFGKWIGDETARCFEKRLDP